MQIEIGDSIIDWIEEKNVSMYSIPHAGRYKDTPMFYRKGGEEISEKPDPQRRPVECPHCEEEHYPLCSEYTEKHGSGWKWVGQSHREPVAHFVARCTHCRRIYKFTLQTPQ